MPRNAKEINRILAEIRNHWMQAPDLRLSQLIINSVDADKLFYTEDGDLLDRIEEYLRKLKRS